MSPAHLASSAIASERPRRSESVARTAAALWKRAHGPLIVLSLAWGCTSSLVITFAIAALAPGNRITITVNQHGEMVIEAAVLAVVWTAVTLLMLAGWRKVWNRQGD